MAKKKMGTPYLRFDGASYFDLGIVPVGDFEIEITARALSDTIKGFIHVGQQTGWNVVQNRLCVSAASTGQVWFANQSTYNNSSGYRMADMLNTKHTYYVSKSQYGVDGVKNALGTYSTGIYNTSIWLGAIQEGFDGACSLMDFFELKCWRDGVLIADIIPFANNQIKNLITDDIRLNLGTGAALLYYE